MPDTPQPTKLEQLADIMGNYERWECEKAVWAVLTELRIPTEGMLDVVTVQEASTGSLSARQYEAWQEQNKQKMALSRRDAKLIFQAMIDHLLNEEGKG